jgi:hypothetical protein
LSLVLVSVWTSSCCTRVLFIPTPWDSGQQKTFKPARGGGKRQSIGSGAQQGRLLPRSLTWIGDLLKLAQLLDDPDRAG